MHSDAQVRPFDMRRRDATVIRSADFDSWDRSQDMPRAIPVIGANFAVDFVKLAEFYFAAKVLAHRTHIAVVLIGRYLIAAIRALAKITAKGVSIDTVASADVMADKQFGFGVDSKPEHSAAPFCGIVITEVGVPRMDKSPHFVQLNEPGANVLHLGVKQHMRFLGCRMHQGKNRLLVQPRESRDSANAHSFQHQGNGLREFLRVRGVRGANVSRGARIGESGRARSAAPTLDFSPPVGSELLAVLVLAFRAGHVRSPLDFCGGTRHNRFSRSRAWVTPRFGLAPTPAETEAGAHYVRVLVYPLGWINGYYHRGTVGSEADLNRDLHCVPPFSCRSVLQALSGSYLKSKSPPVSGPSSQLVERVICQVLYRVSTRFGRYRVHCLSISIRDSVPTRCADFRNGASERRNPAVTTEIASIVPKLHKLFLRNKTLQSVVNRNQGLLVFGEIDAPCHKCISYFGSGKYGFARPRKDEANRVRQFETVRLSAFLNFYKVFVGLRLTQCRQALYRLFQTDDSLLYRGSLFQRFRERFFGFFKGQLERISACHAQYLYQT